MNSTASSQAESGADECIVAQSAGLDKSEECFWCRKGFFEAWVPFVVS